MFLLFVFVVIREMQRREEQGEGKTTVQGDREEEEKGEAPDRGGDEDEHLRNKDGADDSDEDATGKKEPTKQKMNSCPDRKCVPGIIYLGHIPPRLRPKHLRNLLSVYGEIGRIFLQPEGTLYSYLYT